MSKTDKTKKIIKIDFEKEDLIELDRIQNIVLDTLDGCQSVGYKSDKQIFELCLEIFKSITIVMVVAAGFQTKNNPNEYPEYMDFVLGFMMKYFSTYLDDKI